MVYVYFSLKLTFFQTWIAILKARKGRVKVETKFEILGVMKGTEAFVLLVVWLIEWAGCLQDPALFWGGSDPPAAVSSPGRGTASCCPWSSSTYSYTSGLRVRFCIRPLALGRCGCKVQVVQPRRAQVGRNFCGAGWLGVGNDDRVLLPEPSLVPQRSRANLESSSCVLESWWPDKQPFLK